jgi:response regulator RpfG family c-di-GMP phosphodiesterase
MTKVIMVTEHADKETAICAHRLGAFDLLEKPFPLDLLAHTVQRALQVQKIELERQDLLAELAQRQEELFQHQAQLQRINDELTEANQALRMLTRHAGQSEAETVCQLVLKVRAVVLPIIAKFQQEGAFEKYVHELAMLAQHIEALTMDIIAAITTYLHIAPDTVWTHRKNMRRTLNLTRMKYNLGHRGALRTAGRTAQSAGNMRRRRLQKVEESRSLG